MPDQELPTPEQAEQDIAACGFFVGEVRPGGGPILAGVADDEAEARRKCHELMRATGRVHAVYVARYISCPRGWRR